MMTREITKLELIASTWFPPSQNLRGFKCLPKHPIRKYRRLAIISGVATLPSLFGEGLRSARAADDGLQVSIQTLPFQSVQCHNKHIKHQASLYNSHHATHTNELLKFTTQQIFVQLSPKFLFLKKERKRNQLINSSKCINALIPINLKENILYILSAILTTNNMLRL